MALCKCGCGKEVTSPKYEYLHNHWVRGKKGHKAWNVGMHGVNAKIPFDLEDMKRLYFEEHKSTIKIAIIYGSNNPTVWRFLKKNGVKMSTSFMLRHHERTEEHNRNISRANKGRLHTTEEKANISAGMLRAAANGHPGCWAKGHKPNITPERNAKLSKALTGQKRPSITGPNHPYWRGGVGFKYSRYKGNDVWDEIRKRILQRDLYTCQRCQVKRQVLHVHHVMPFRISRDDSDGNLISLCSSCHRKEEWAIQRTLYGAAS